MTSQQVILDTDWYTDVDDVMALRVLLRLQQYNHLKLLGVCLNASFEESVRSVDAFLLAHGVDVPVGIIQNWEKDFSGRNGPSYQKYLAQLPSKYKGNSDAEAPVKLYRRLLATSPEKVTLFSIGFTENYAELLESPPDEFSPLTGMELARKKVEKLFMMAGFWPRGSEYNLTGGSPVNPIVTRAGSIVLANWPTPITFLGFEVGNTVLAGAKLPGGDLLRQAMDAFDRTPGYRLGGKAPEFQGLGQERAHFCWDPLLILLGAGVVSPDSGMYGLVRGQATSNPDTGENSFLVSSDGAHAYVVKNRPDFEYGQLVDKWL
ncbi:MAG: nucleoside hydrolase [Victivallales bacterium]|nr:nucleoside hydrolase [Victivallales bacterium]MBQ6473908.1 nucleoside hydrolase [Victivallales bacterium]